MNMAPVLLADQFETKQGGRRAYAGLIWKWADLEGGGYLFCDGLLVLRSVWGQIQQRNTELWKTDGAELMDKISP